MCVIFTCYWPLNLSFSTVVEIFCKLAEQQYSATSRVIQKERRNQTIIKMRMSQEDYERFIIAIGGIENLQSYAEQIFRNCCDEVIATSS